MVRKSRSAGVAAVMVGLCLGITGCMGMYSNDPPGMNQTNEPYTYMNRTPSGSGNPGANYNPTLVGSQNQSRGGVQQAAYYQTAPPPGNTSTSSAPNPGAIPGQPTEFVEERNGFGIPVGAMQPINPPIPTELNRTTHPPHRVAAPDTLYIEALRMIPKGPYRLEPLEVLLIEVPESFNKQDIKGNFMISPEGTINLGYNYGTVRIGGLTVDQAQVVIRNHLNNILKNPTVNVALVQMRGMQNVRGEHLVRPDGTIHLGMYGSVYVAGMQLGQIKCVIEQHLSAYLVDPQVSVDVFTYNSRKIYIIADGAGYGQQVIALPSTGNETVLDAISRVQGLPPVASQKRIWVARPSPAGYPCSIILPVDWKAIVQAGRTETNYQLLPGDRIFISSDPLITTYNYLDKILAPVERVLGVTLLGSSTVQSLRGTNPGVLLAR